MIFYSPDSKDHFLTRLNHITANEIPSLSIWGIFKERSSQPFAGIVGQDHFEIVLNNSFFPNMIELKASLREQEGRCQISIKTENLLIPSMIYFLSFGLFILMTTIEVIQGNENYIQLFGSALIGVFATFFIRFLVKIQADHLIQLFKLYMVPASSNN